MASLRIWLAGRIAFNAGKPLDLDTPKQKADFLDDLATPGVYKMMQFAICYASILKSGDPQQKEALELVSAFISSYVELLSRFDRLQSSGKSNPAKTTELKEKIVSCTAQLRNATNAISQARAFCKIRTDLGYSWLLNLNDFLDDIDTLI